MTSALIIFNSKFLPGISFEGAVSTSSYYFLSLLALGPANFVPPATFLVWWDFQHFS